MKVEVEIVTVKDGNLKEIKIDDKIYQLQRVSNKPIQRLPEKVKRRYQMIEPKGAIGRDEVYNVWIIKSELNSVKESIQEITNLKYDTTINNISMKTTFTTQRVRAILHFMKTKGQVFQRKRKNRMVTYHLVEK